MLTFCKGRPVSPKAICSSPVGLTGVLFKALFEFFSSAHVHSKLNLLFWRGGGGETRGARKIWGLQAVLPSIQLFIWTVFLDTILICHSPSDTCCCTLASIPKDFNGSKLKDSLVGPTNNESLTSEAAIVWHFTSSKDQRGDGREEGKWCVGTPPTLRPAKALLESHWRWWEGPRFL